MVWAISRPDQGILYPETDSRLWALTIALVTYELEVGPKLSTIEGGRQGQPGDRILLRLLPSGEVRLDQL